MYLFAIHVSIFLSLFRSVDHLNIRLLSFLLLSFLINLERHLKNIYFKTKSSSKGSVHWSVHEISSVGEISSVIPASWPGAMMLCAGALRLEDAVESFMAVDDGRM